MKTILVVDDERNIVELVRLYLEKEGFAVVAASDGDQALVQYERTGPDLVVLDLMLPKLSGLAVLEALRREACRACVMILTAKDMLDDRVRGLNAGADDYFSKPVEFARLLPLLAQIAAPGPRLDPHSIR